MSITPKLLLATTNPGKVAEMRALLSRHFDRSQLTVLTPADLGVPMPEIEETGATFADNALQKAQALAAASGCPALADDSGLCVDALGGAPGLHSARWAGPAATDAERTELLVRRMAAVPGPRRTARFVCALAAVTPDGRAAVAEGACEGVVAPAPRGAGGFGYDPVFLLPALGRTLAELRPDEKNVLSHRAAALARLAPRLSSLLRPTR